MARLKIYTDENVDVRVAEGLRRRGVAASTVYDEQNVGIIDEAQLARAAALGAVIFVDMHRLRLGECIRRLALYAEVVTAEEMINRIEFL